MSAAQAAAINAIENNTILVFNRQLLVEELKVLDPALSQKLAWSLQDEEELARKQQEYISEFEKLERLAAKQKILEQARYKPNQAGELMVDQQVLSLMMHNATQGERTATQKLVQSTLDRTYEALNYLEEKGRVLVRLGRDLDEYAHSHPASAWMVDQAKQKLVSTVGYTQNLMRETAPLIREAAYSAAMISGGLYGASLGTAAGGIGAGPGAVLGMAGGWATAKVSELGFEYAHLSTPK